MTRREYTAPEIEQVNVAEQQLRARGLDEQSERIGIILDGYFQTNRSVPVTAEAVVKLVESQPGLKWLSQANLEYNRVAAENPQAAQQLVDWMAATQGRPGALVNTGDQAYENLTLLLTTLRGYEVSPPRIRDAENRIANRPGRHLHYVPEPRRTEVKSAVAKADADYSVGKPFTSDLIKNADGSYRSPTFHEQKAAREAVERAKSAETASASAQALVRDAQRLATEIQGSTHSETDQLRKLFATSGTEINWPETLALRQQMQKQFARHR